MIEMRNYKIQSYKEKYSIIIKKELLYKAEVIQQRNTEEKKVSELKEV